MSCVIFVSIHPDNVSLAISGVSEFTNLSSASGVSRSLPQPPKRVETRGWLNHISYGNGCGSPAANTRRAGRPFTSFLFNGIEQVQKLVDALSYTFNHEVT